jgi:hypothetical protein
MIKQSANKMTWDEAVVWCNALGKGYHMPSILELCFFIDYEKRFPAAIGEIKPSAYWSSTTLTASRDNAWYVDFFYGEVLFTEKTSNKYFAMAVRDERNEH